jgi:hypothetical protein
VEGQLQHANGQCWISIRADCLLPNGVVPSGIDL